ncbi:MAG: protein kinase, partial [Deltaproteobacteria bacterium]|nr:protein kinase [Deltaproteobacteria bacterium]
MRACPQCGLRYPADADKCFVDRSPLVEMEDPRLGTLLAGRYLLEAVLGEGGMAIVYRARHTLIDRPVAVKVLAPKLSRDQGLRERFRREAKNAAQLAHPNIVEIFDSGDTDDGSAYLVMELLVGESLQKIIERGAVEVPRAVNIGIQIARALARAHDFQVIHRDLKPDNIFVVEGNGSDVVKLLDFGIARSMADSRLTSTGDVFGTPQYMAPERVTSIDAGPGADLYALGVILFETVCGRLPFEADDLPGFFIKHMQETPPRPTSIVASIPRRLEALILSLLEKDPGKRPVDAHAVMRELEALSPKARHASAKVLNAQAMQSTRVAATLPPTTLDHWSSRAKLFDEMLRSAYPRGDAPAELSAKLGQIHAILKQLSDLRASSLSEQRKLDVIESRGREGRQRFGYAVDALGIDASEGRKGARLAREQLEQLDVETSTAERSFRERHGTVLSLEGRVGVDEPRTDLAAAYRAVADAMDAWGNTRARRNDAAKTVAAKEREVEDTDFQIEELRRQLERLEATVEEERIVCETRFRQAGREITKLESQLLEIASAFCAPLRGQRALSHLFARLEAEQTAPGNTP